LNIPASHARHFVLPLSDENPAEQFKHSLADMEALRYCPFLHGLHGVPASPASHFVHLALPGSDFSPSAQISHFVELEFSLFSLAAHGLHDDFPVSFWNSPGMQGKQDPLPLVGFLNPARHFKQVVGTSSPPRYSPSPQLSHSLVAEFCILPAAQSLQAAAPAGLVRPFVQLIHDSCFVKLANMFSAHSWQAICFTSLLNLPGIHGRQYASPFSFW
jgi:hypothetical protein